MQFVVLTKKKCTLLKEKYWWIQMFEINDMKIKKTQGKKQVE
jgi:hypothetical protein